MKKIVLTSLLAIAATGASAQIYVGGDLGLAQAPTDCSAGYSCKDTSLGYKLYAGYDDTQAIAGELGYISFGKAKVDNDALGLRGELKAHAVTLALVFRGRFNADLVGLARFGAASVSVKQTANGVTIDSGNGMNVYVGLGLEYALAPHIKATASVDMTQGGTDGGNDGSLFLLGAGVKYEF